MASFHVARSASVRKPLTAVTTSDSPKEPGRTFALEPRVRLCPTPHLTADQYVRLLSCIDDEGGVTTLDVIARALPRVHQPVSAVFDLCDAGILNVDWEAAFDGDMHVWRVDH